MSDGIEVKVNASDLGRLQKVFAKMKKQSTDNAHKASRAMAAYLVQQVKQYASGRPGPDIVTGAYNASIVTMGAEDSGTSSTAFAGTSAVQAHRLESGFVGTDSLGRHYHQPAFPHWKPGLVDLDNNKARFGKMLSAGIVK